MIETDSGVYGIGEAYWGPGVKDLILTQMKPLLLGEEPQLRNTRLTGRRNDSRIRALFKPGTPRASRIIT